MCKSHNTSPLTSDNFVNQRICQSCIKTHVLCTSVARRRVRRLEAVGTCTRMPGCQLVRFVTCVYLCFISVCACCVCVCVCACVHVHVCVCVCVCVFVERSGVSAQVRVGVSVLVEWRQPGAVYETRGVRRGLGGPCDEHSRS